MAAAAGWLLPFSAGGTDSAVSAWRVPKPVCVGVLCGRAFNVCTCTPFQTGSAASGSPSAAVGDYSFFPSLFCCCLHALSHLSVCSTEPDELSLHLSFLNSPSPWGWAQWERLAATNDLNINSGPWRGLRRVSW